MAPYNDLAAVQERLDRPADSARKWEQYLVAHPKGRWLGRALWRLAESAEAAGRADEALALRRRLVVEAPAAPEAPHLSLGSRRFLGIFLRFHLDTPPAPRRLAFELLESDPASFGAVKGESR